MHGNPFLAILAAFISMLAFSFSASALAQNDKWTPMTGANTLREFMSGLTAERALPNGQVSRGEYRADGTGVLRSWGATIPRTWEIKGEDQLCITAEGETQCYQLDKSASVPDLYRARSVTAGAVYEFTVTGRVARALADEKGVPPEAGATGGPAAPSAAEIAKELSNPATPV